MRRMLLIVGALGVLLAVLVATGAYRPGESQAASGTTGAGAATGAAAAITTAAPSTPRGSLVLGGQAGGRAVGLAVTREGGGKLTLQATVLGQDGLLASGLHASFAVHGAQVAKAAGEACGHGCYRATLAAETPAHVVVQLGSTSADFLLPARWKPAGALVERATAAFEHSKSVVYDEHLESRPGNAIETRWTLIAPDRLEYRIHGGADGIVIGSRRWDREPGKKWVESAQDRLTVLEPPWAAGSVAAAGASTGSPVSDASLIGNDRLDGKAVRVVSFMLRGSPPTWFTVWIDKRTYRPVSMQMTTAAHFMTQDYRVYGGNVAIEPPH